MSLKRSIQDVDASEAPQQSQHDLEISLGEIQNLKPGVSSMKANRYMKTILHQWHEIVAQDEEKSRILLDTKLDMLPMFVLLRKCEMNAEQLVSLLTILYYLQRKNYMKANESYMKLSIGNVAWPIGVVSVSIHARSRDTKIMDGKANIMLDETTRKWITCVKRMVTFCEQHKI